MVEDAAEQEQIPLTGKMVVAGLQPDVAAPHHDTGYQSVSSLGFDRLDADNSLLVGQESLRLPGVLE